MSYWMAWKMIWRNKRRTLFSLAGVVLGIISVTVIFSLAEGGKESIEGDLAALAENRIMLQGKVAVKDVQMLEGIPYVRYAFLPQAKIKEQNILLTGYSKKALEAKGISQNLRDREVILEEKTALKIFDRKYPRGERIQGGNRGEAFIVAGTYREESLLESAKENNEGIITLERLKKFTGIKMYSQVVVGFHEKENARELAPLIISQLKRAHRGREEYSLVESSGKYRRSEKIKKTLNIFLGTIGMVALVMGGLGISNLMAAIVRERTPQIGILRAMGTGEVFILRIFLVEAVIISTTGGMIGISAGVAGAKLVGKLIGISPIFRAEHLILIFIVSILLGVFFGIMPAKKAAEKDPVEALRSL